MAIDWGVFPLVLILTVTPAVAERDDPLSAIDWLSNSVDAPPLQAPVVNGPSANLPDEIQVAPLDAAVPDQLGTKDAAALGVPVAIWGKSTVGDLVQDLAALELGRDAPPSIRTFLTDLLQARLDPPIDAGIDDRFFLARIDTLLALGHLESAENLLGQTSRIDPRYFRRSFDIALLTGEETTACQVIDKSPELSPTYPARIFCLARLAQFDVAALTLGNAETLGILTPDEDALLRIFLDPELFEDEPVPAAPRVPTPLEYRLFEAVGERIPTDQLPVAFATADLSETVGWKTRLRAAERLAATGAVTFDDLLVVYNERSPAASGGVWDRVRAIRALEETLRRNADAQLQSELGETWRLVADMGYQSAFADWIVPKLDGKALTGSGAAVAFEIALFAKRPDLASQFAKETEQDRFLLDMVNGVSRPAPPGDAFASAILRGLSSIEAGGGYAPLLKEARTGEVVLRALAALAEGASGNPETTVQALTALRQIGLNDLARQIAVELILIEGAA